MEKKKWNVARPGYHISPILFPDLFLLIRQKVKHNHISLNQLDLVHHGTI